MRVVNGTTEEDVLRQRHLARGQSAIERAAVTCRYAGIEGDAAQVVPTGPEARAAHAVRLSARALDHRAQSAPDPAADARCARNAAATALVAAEVARSHGGGGELFDAAYQAALAASRAAGNAAGREGLGRSEALNALADAAEEAAVAAAETAGWIEVGEVREGRA